MAEIQVRVSPDSCEAALVVPVGIDSSLLTAEALLPVLRAAEIEISESILASLAGIVGAYGAGENSLEVVLAWGTEPIPGTDGHVQWAEGFDPRDHHVTGQDSERIDYYAGRRYVPVKAGDTVAFVREPKQGTDGRDVRGRSIPAPSGAPADFEHDSSFTVDTAGRVKAVSDGVLTIHDSRLSITQALDVPGDVDFSTGHVDFAGAVDIHGGVRSGFNVKAAGDIRVRGQIESATIDCGCNFEAQGGMAGDGRGSVRVEGDARVSYLDRIVGTVKGDLHVARELVGCRLAVGGSLFCPGGTVMGGELDVTGSLTANVLGSVAGAETTVRLGDVPMLREAFGALAREFSTVKAKLARLTEQERAIRLNPHPSPGDKERLTELAFEARDLNRELKTCAGRLGELDVARRTSCKLDVQIAKIIHPSVTLEIGELSVQFRESLKGPVSLGWDEKHDIVCRIGSGEARPIADFARVVRRAAAPVRAAA